MLASEIQIGDILFFDGDTVEVIESLGNGKFIVEGQQNGQEEAHCSRLSTNGPVDWDRPATWTGAIDRSPCGTGTCAKMATLYARGQLGLHEDFRHQGVLDTIFTGRLVEETQVGPYQAVVPTLSGQAWITSIASYMVDPTDPFPDGFTVGDIWS